MILSPSTYGSMTWTPSLAVHGNNCINRVFAIVLPIVSYLLFHVSITAMFSLRSAAKSRETNIKSSRLQHIANSSSLSTIRYPSSLHLATPARSPTPNPNFTSHPPQIEFTLTSTQSNFPFRLTHCGLHLPIFPDWPSTFHIGANYAPSSMKLNLPANLLFSELRCCVSYLTSSPVRPRQYWKLTILPRPQ